jgi:hypothetical protein
MSEPDQTPEPAAPRGPSGCYAQMFFIFLVLSIIGVSGRDSWWGIIPHLLALGILAWGAWESVSRKSFEHIQKQYPTETREHYRVNSLFSFLFVPGLTWLLLGFPALYYWIRH